MIKCTSCAKALQGTPTNFSLKSFPSATVNNAHVIHWEARHIGRHYCFDCYKEQHPSCYRQLIARSDSLSEIFKNTIPGLE